MSTKIKGEAIKDNSAPLNSLISHEHLLAHYKGVDQLFKNTILKPGNNLDVSQYERLYIKAVNHNGLLEIVRNSSLRLHNGPTVNVIWENNKLYVDHDATFYDIKIYKTISPIEYIESVVLHSVDGEIKNLNEYFEIDFENQEFYSKTDIIIKYNNVENIICKAGEVYYFYDGAYIFDPYIIIDVDDDMNLRCFYEDGDNYELIVTIDLKSISGVLKTYGYQNLQESEQEIALKNLGIYNILKYIQKPIVLPKNRYIINDREFIDLIYDSNKFELKPIVMQLIVMKDNQNKYYPITYVHGKAIHSELGTLYFDGDEEFDIDNPDD